MTTVVEWAAIDRVQVGTSASCTLEVTEELVDTFACLSQDTNPLHLDAETARACGFPGRVAHGMLALSAISRLIGTRLPGPGSLWLSQEVQFAAPVLVGDRLEARVTVQTVSRAAQAVALATLVVNSQTGTVVLRGV